MKLFKSLLVAPATLGLLTPMSATANEVTINDFNAAEEIAVTNSRVDGLEARLNNFEAGSFSETTTASFSADFAIGAVDGKGIVTSPRTSVVTDGDEAIEAVYSFQIDLSTSFTGEDSLDISLDAGNAVSTGALGELDLNNGEELSVDGISYTFPVGGLTAFVGDNTDGSLLYDTACVYASPTNTLDDCGNKVAALGSGSGTAAGASYDFGNGFTGAVGYTGAGSDSEKGLFTKEGDDSYGAQLSYSGDSYGASVTYANTESSGSDTSYWAMNAYFSPSESGNVPSISVGYEVGDPEAANAKDTTQYFVGLQWDEAGPGTLGVGFGTDGAFADGATEYMFYEAFYAYEVNDGMTITPLVYIRENDATKEDQTGIMVKTSFSF
nr:carbohydrate porin [Prochlorococcus marinus]